MPRIDDSHAPFKRKRTIGPGPKKAPPITQTKRWRCERATPKRQKAGFYTQLCRDTETGRVVTIRAKKSKKKAYNKLYRKWAAKHRAKLAVRPAIRSYRCRRTRVAQCR